MQYIYQKPSIFVKMDGFLWLPRGIKRSWRGTGAFGIRAVSGLQQRPSVLHVQTLIGNPLRQFAVAAGFLVTADYSLQSRPG